MLIVNLKDDITCQRESRLYRTWGEFYEDTFSPLVFPTKVIELKLHGKTYSEKKECLKSIVMDLTDVVDLSYMELCLLQAWIETNAQRFGLVNEFTDNGIL